MTNTRKLVILLLDDENGINEAAYNELMADIPNDILEVVQTANGRYFLDETDAERLMEVKPIETQPCYARHIYDQQQATKA